MVFFSLYREQVISLLSNNYPGKITVDDDDIAIAYHKRMKVADYINGLEKVNDLKKYCDE
jgi:hypothetical protein